MIRTSLLVFVLALSAVADIDVTVTEGTSMAVAVSPDGKTLAVDLQGSIWTLPAAGGVAKRITDVFNDARQPVWSPDGKWIAFFAYRDGGYDLWEIAPDGTNQHKLTVGPFDDREPAWSHDGARIAFASDRGNALGSSYNIWVLDVATGDVKRLTNDPSENHMPSWSPDDSEIAFSSTRDGGHSVWAVRLSDGVERTLTTAEGTVEAPSWGPGGKVVYHIGPDPKSELDVDGKTLTGSENAFSFRASWASATEFYYVSDGKIRKRSVNGGGAQTIEFKATLPVNPARYTRRKRDFDSTAPRQALGIVAPVLSPDGKKVAFAALGDIYVMSIGGKPENITHDKYLDTDPAWSRDGNELVYSSDRGGKLLDLWIHDFRSGQDRQLTHLTTQPQGSTWSPDGKRIAFFDVDGMWRAAGLSVVDIGTGKVARIHETLFGPGAPTWSPDSKRIALVETGDVRNVPLDLKYTPAIPKDRIVVHASRLVDGKSAGARSNVDIVIEGNRIVSVGPHNASLHANAKLVDATGLTAMPGLIESHSHLQKDLGTAEDRAWLAFGVTTVRSPGNTPYEGVEDREANDAGVRFGPRIFTAGFLMEWQRVYYKMGVAISGPAQFEMELERSRILQHDLIKSYVRLPDLQQRRMVEFAHGIGVPVATHEIYPAAYVSVDNTEHTAATSRRGYSPKTATLSRTYEDVVQLFGKSQRYLTPTLFNGGGVEKMLADEPGLRSDPRFGLYPEWLQKQLLNRAGPGLRGTEGSYKMVMDIMKAGGKIVAGTDSPHAFNLHGELMSYVLAGMTPYEALKAATVNSAEALNLDAGAIEAGKLADIVIVEGNPLDNIENAHKVRRVIANGRVFELNDLLSDTKVNLPSVSRAGR